MIKTFNFDYDYCEAKVVIKLDTDLFTEEHAQSTLDFFLWDYDEENDPVEEVLRKYAMEIIRVATKDSLNVFGVTREFDNKEGFLKLDGSLGLTLVSVTPYEFNDEKLECTIF
jgi:hypothetical protein